MILLQYLPLCFCLLLNVQALYEDQAGKFDWRQQLVGRPVGVLLDGQQPLVVTTEQNVLAAINHKSGELLWRRVLERGSAGRLRLLLPSGDDLVTFSGDNLVRVWSAASGQMVSETALDVTDDTDGETYVLSAGGAKELLVLQLSAAGSALRRVTVRSGEVSSETLRTPWAGGVSCVAGLESLLCRDSAQLYTFSAGSGKFSAAPLPPALSGSRQLRHLGGDLFSAAAAGRLTLFRVTPAFETVLEQAGDVACVTGLAGQEVLYVGTNDRSQTVPAVQFATVSLSSGPASSSAGRVLLTARHGPVSACHVSTAAAAPRLLLVGDDDAVTMAKIGGGVLWTREEALASIQAVEVVDLPMSANQVSIEEEFGDQAGDPVSALLLRMSSQWSQLTALAAGVVRSEPDRSSDVSHLTRDSFNTHKMLVVVTACGKLLGLHSETGAVLWAVPVPGLTPLAGSSLVLGLQRGTAHFPHPPLSALLARRTLVTFNPITGGELAVHRLDFEVAQASLLGHTDNTHLKPLLILDTDGAVHVWPETAAALAKSMNSKLFFYMADAGTSIMQGYAVSPSLETVPSWRLDLGSQGQTIRRVLAKSPHERVHSQGRVLADRSVLYKYSNPNLVLVLTDAPDPGLKNSHSTSAYLVDAVTGHLVYSHVQKRVRCPCHAVHSENWLVYSVYNERFRRTELTSIELFEGKTQANASAFSSLDAPLQPMVERQTFIFPSQIEAMRETTTEKSITTKFIIFALPSGSLVSLNRVFLDPRRPLLPGARTGLEEGLPPYTPELPLPAVNVVNYNQTLLNVAGVLSSPSGLESTCLVFVYGLDLYHTRVFPSNMFDQLKDDFDSTFIVLVLVGLVTASAVTRRLSQRRALQQAWK